MNFHINPKLRRTDPEAVAARKQRRQLAARRTLSVLPTLCTLGNLLSGFMAVFFASRAPDLKLPFGWTPLTFAAIFIFVGMLFDALDGRIARMTRSVSDLGEQLDSMADMVTFGLAPAFMAVQIIGVQAPFVSDANDHWFDRLVLVIAGLYVCCAALRLARFNAQIDLPSERDHSSFKGLPSPAAGGTVASLILLHQHYDASFARLLAAHPETNSAPLAMWYTSIVTVAVMLLVAIAMVSSLRYTHMVNRYMRGRRPARYIAWLVAGLLMMMVYPQISLAAVFVVYALSAPLQYLWRQVTGASGSLTPVPAVPGSIVPTPPAEPAHDQQPPKSAQG